MTEEQKQILEDVKKLIEENNGLRNRIAYLEEEIDDLEDRLLAFME